MTSGDRIKVKENRNLIIQIADLEQGPVTLDCSMPLDWLKDRMSFCEYDATPINASVKLDVQSTGNGIWIRGYVFANIKTQCGTCLKEVIIGIESAINSYLLPLAEYEKECDKSELTPEDLDREFYDGETVALDEMMGDAIMLELPMNPKCESSCPGLAAFSENQTETAPSIDPRLAPLLGLRINKEN